MEEGSGTWRKLPIKRKRVVLIIQKLISSQASATLINLFLTALKAMGLMSARLLTLVLSASVSVYWVADTTGWSFGVVYKIHTNHFLKYHHLQKDWQKQWQVIDNSFARIMIKKSACTMMMVRALHSPKSCLSVSAQTGPAAAEQAEHCTVPPALHCPRLPGPQ